MFSFSKFKNYPVFIKEKEIGYIVDVLFDKINQKVTGFVLKKTIFNYSSFMLKDIESVENEKIIIKQENKENNIENYEILEKRVYDLFGNKIGIVEDVEFYSNSGKLSSISVNIELNFYSINRFYQKLFSKNYVKIQAKNIISFEKDRIIIKNSNFIKESKKILENLSKFLINVPKNSYSFKKF